MELSNGGCSSIQDMVTATSISKSQILEAVLGPERNPTIEIGAPGKPTSVVVIRFYVLDVRHLIIQNGSQPLAYDVQISS